jgi:hypothetical protein
MYRILLRITALVLFCHIAEFAAVAQTQAREEQRITITVDSFCSDTKLRTSNARVRWSIPGVALEATGVRDFGTAKQSLEVTVYKNGFDKGLLASVPIQQATPERPVAAQAQQKRPIPRAFQFSLIEVEQPKTSPATQGDADMGAVVEGLEPGVNYTWRIAIETSSGKIVSAPVTSQATTCPADMAPAPSARKKRTP